MTIKEQAINFIKYGKPGNYIENDKNRRKVVRISSGVNTLPDCMMYEDGKPVGIEIIYDAIDFLLGGTK